MSERNLLVTAKADRENELVRTLIQLSSAGLLLIPAVVTSQEVDIPRFGQAILFYLGLISISMALILAVVEQHLSSMAYERQMQIVFDYYTKVSDLDHDKNWVAAVRWSRTFSLVFFSAGVILTAIGMAMLL